MSRQYVRTPPEDRFWPKVHKTDTCWLWKGYVGNHGYGMFTLSTRNPKLAHRLSYQWTVGEIPEGLELDHLCRNRQCVNPAHLEPVLHVINSRRGDTGQYLKRRTHCPKGHPYNEENTYRTKRGGRACRECRNIAVKDWYERKSLEIGRVHKRNWTHCKRGHLFTDENTYRRGGKRACRTCRAEFWNTYVRPKDRVLSEH